MLLEKRKKNDSPALNIMCMLQYKDLKNKPEKSIIAGGCPRGVIVKAMDCGIVVSEFVLQSCYYVHFRANTLRKGMNHLILPAMG